MEEKNIVYLEKLEDYIPEFMEEFVSQIRKDQLRWGDTWKSRGLIWNGKTQEERMFARIADYKDQHEHGGTPVPYMKIVGEAFINWVREKEHMV